MRKFLLFIFCSFMAVSSPAQEDSASIVRAFPITSYILTLNDSTILVQLEMPEVVKLYKNQLGILVGKYEGDKNEVVEKGYGQCVLIKGNFYYFDIGHNESHLPAKKGDLLYVSMKKTNMYNEGYMPQLASHFIRLQNIYEEPFYDRYLIFRDWTKEKEEKTLDSILSDIQNTGIYFREHNPSMDVAIKEGKYKGQYTFDVMINCQKNDLLAFLKYVVARPRLYAGATWKVSELFAAWASQGAPMVKEENEKN
ncbi:MAG TPA: hypothetical protein PKW62_03410 [Chitinophagaceae bacterium]|nr:hypothetical protein [Chitinophagaceae bacterium]